MKKLILITLLLSSIYGMSCKKKDISDCTENEKAGIVLYKISCNDFNGFAYLIETSIANTADTFATTTLPDVYKIERHEIFFKIKPSSGELTCTANVIPPSQVFDVFDVSLSPCSND